MAKKGGCFLSTESINDISRADSKFSPSSGDKVYFTFEGVSDNIGQTAFGKFNRIPKARIGKRIGKVRF